MSSNDCFFNLQDPAQGIIRELAPGLTARIFAGDQAMLSLVRIDPHAEGETHRHPEEQWGVLLEGDGTRVQDGRDYVVSAGDFWRTPGNVTHTFRAGASGATILDVFSPPREEYRLPQE